MVLIEFRSIDSLCFRFLLVKTKFQLLMFFKKKCVSNEMSIIDYILKMIIKDQPTSFADKHDK